jgi:hypothetical protein
MPSFGPNLPGTGADNASIGTIAWAQPTRINADDASNTIATLTVSTQSHYLVSSSHGFAVPGGATITGIQCEANGLVDGNAGDVLTNSVKLVKGGVISGDDLAESNLWPFSDDGTRHSWGGDGQMWGLTLTPADVNATNFGFALSMKNTGAATRVAQMDAFWVTVYIAGQARPFMNVTIVI